MKLFKHASISSIIAVLVSCSMQSNDTITMDHQRGHTGKIGYDAPALWTHQDSKLRTSTTSVWTPTNNAAKESISVIRTEVHLPATAGVIEIQKLLLQAQGELRDAHVSPPTEIASTTGLRGVEVDVDFIPSNMARRYHRIHAVLIDGDSLIHVSYTAADPDENREAFRLIMNSLRHEEV